jgi:hypothetical protein
MLCGASCLANTAFNLLVCRWRFVRVLESQITSCIIDASQEERVTLISILVFIVPDSTMMFVHLSVNVMLMDGYKHH